MYSAMMPVSAAAVSLFFRNRTILKREKSSTHIITYILPPTLVVGMLLPWSTKKRPALRVEGVFVGLCTTLRRAFALEQATHGVQEPDSSTSSCLPVSRVIYSLGWPSSRCAYITPRDSNALEDNALFTVLLQRCIITSNKPDSPRRKVQMVFFPRPSCALFGLLMKGSPDLSLARCIERGLRPRAGTWATFCSATVVMPPGCWSSSVNRPYP